MKVVDKMIKEKLKEWVIENYNHEATGYTSLRSFGNADDVFNDGMECGVSCAAYEVGKILEMDLEEPIDTYKYEEDYY